MDLDLIVRNATLTDGRKGQDVAVAAGRIAAAGRPPVRGRSTFAREPTPYARCSLRKATDFCYFNLHDGG